MVKDLDLVGAPLEMYCDSQKCTFLIVLHLYKGSMCELLKETYLNKHRCLTENELKHLLKNRVLDTLQTMHSNGYIHGDIKPENLVYEFKDNQSRNYDDILSAIVDYDLYETKQCK